MSFERPRRLRSAYSGLTAHGESWVWLTGGALAMAIAMITGLLLFIVMRGASTFWPMPLERVELVDGRQVLGEITGREEVGQRVEDVQGDPAAAAGPQRQVDRAAHDRTGDAQQAHRLVGQARHQAG